MSLRQRYPAGILEIRGWDSGDNLGPLLKVTERQDSYFLEDSHGHNDGLLWIKIPNSKSKQRLL
jgi:hypothetical protein